MTSRLYTREEMMEAFVEGWIFWDARSPSPSRAEKAAKQYVDGLKDPSPETGTAPQTDERPELEVQVETLAKIVGELIFKLPLFVPGIGQPSYMDFSMRSVTKITTHFPELSSQEER